MSGKVKQITPSTRTYTKGFGDQATVRTPIFRTGAEMLQEEEDKESLRKH